MAPPPPPYGYQQVFVSNYLLPAPPVPVQAQATGNGGGKKGKKSTEKLASKSSTHLPRILQGDMPNFVPGAHFFNDGANAWQAQLQGIQQLNQGTALYDLISSKLDAVITGIDGEKFSGDENELYIDQSAPQTMQWQGPYDGQEQGVVSTRALGFTREGGKKKEKGKEDRSCPVAGAIGGANYFAKVDLYANSRLPPDLPPVKL
jgi:hypothetical protein